MWSARLFSRYGAWCGMRACFLSMGLGVECTRAFRYSDRCGMRACFLGMGFGVECARVFSVWG